ncbi:MAG: lytic transglycosylase domain-containing protein [Clostridia bacterium]|nr:lytic transglycosylase domain-containing protein [Clostridia bacterium]
MAKGKKKSHPVLKALLIVLCVLLAVELVLALFADDILRRYYRTAYEDLVGRYAALYDVPETLVNAVILCESGFRADAESGAGAKGLMQMRDASFGEMRERLGLPAGDVFDPEQNIQCGVYCLSYLKRFFGSWDTALAAYNGGIGNVQNWLSNPAYSSDGKTLDVIPFQETARYVQKVKRARRAYEILYSKMR